MKVTVCFDGELIAEISVREDATHAQALENAFILTQNRRGSWSRGPKFDDGVINEDYCPTVKRLAPLPIYNGVTYGHRSSMVGDMFLVEDDEDIHTYECKSLGFEKVF